MDKISSKDIKLKAEAQQKTTSKERLKELASIRDELAEIVAQNIAASPELLSDLASHTSQAVRKAVTSNPNTSTETLLQLAEDFPQEFLENPVFELLYLENSDFLKDIPFNTLYALLQKENTPNFLLKYAKDNYRSKKMITEALKMHVKISGEISQGWHEVAEQNANYHIHYRQFLQRLDFNFLSYFINFVPEKTFNNISFRIEIHQHTY